LNASVPGVKIPIIATPTSSLAPLFKKSKGVSKSTKVVKESGARNTSDDAGDAVTIRQRIDDFVPPKGYKRFNKIKIAGVQSIMYQYGVKVVSINNLDPPLWYCLANQKLYRGKKKGFPLHPKVPPIAQFI
jgi:hypothetical protein